METKIKILNNIFDVELTLDDLEKELCEVFEWNSFYIMNFLVDMEDRFHKKITVEQISEVKYVYELLHLMERE